MRVATNQSEQRSDQSEQPNRAQSAACTPGESSYWTGATVGDGNAWWVGLWPTLALTTLDPAHLSYLLSSHKPHYLKTGSPYFKNTTGEKC